MDSLKNLAPVIVDTFPKNDSEIDVDTIETISVTFNKKMDGAYSWVNQGFWNFQEVTNENYWSEDMKTHSIKVKLEKNTTYVLMINSSEYKGFASNKIPAIPYIMYFHTKA
jgi:hypothetical protein